MSNVHLPATTEPSVSQEASERRAPLIPIGYVIAGVVVTLVVAVLSTALLVYLANNYADTILVVRDIFIIALGLMSCLSGIVLILLLIAVTRLINMLEFELKPILMKTNETLGTIRGTTVFMSQNVVRPMTTASSYMAGIRRGVNTLFGNPRR
jgi:cytochrome c biogenesis protein CcdA